MQLIQIFLTLFFFINHPLQIREKIGILIENYLRSMLILNICLEFLKVNRRV